MLDIGDGRTCYMLTTLKSTILFLCQQFRLGRASCYISFKHSSFLEIQIWSRFTYIYLFRTKGIYGMGFWERNGLPFYPCRWFSVSSMNGSRLWWWLAVAVPRVISAEFNTRHPWRAHRALATLFKIKKKFEKTGFVHHRGRSGQARTQPTRTQQLQFWERLFRGPHAVLDNFRGPY